MGIFKKALDVNKLINQEKLILEVTESIFREMEKRNISKSELATRLDRSNAHVSQLLNGNRNMTLRTLADISGAIGVEPHFGLGFYDQLSEAPQWEVQGESAVKPGRKIRCQSVGIDALTENWANACEDFRAA